MSHATAVVHLKVHNAPLCSNELRGVSIGDIEDYERLLMEGINYQFRCHHPHSAMRALALDFTNFVEMRDEGGLQSGPYDNSHVNELLERATAIVQRSMVFSDAQFLFAPGHVGFAVVAIALGSAVGEDGSIGDDLHQYLLDRFARKPREDLQAFLDKVSQIVRMLHRCEMMDLAPVGNNPSRLVARRAEEMKRVLGKISSLRICVRRRSSWEPSRRVKRSRFEPDFTPPRKRMSRTCAKVTPVGHG